MSHTNSVPLRATILQIQPTGNTPLALNFDQEQVKITADTIITMLRSREQKRRREKEVNIPTLSHPAYLHFWTDTILLWRHTPLTINSHRPDTVVSIIFRIIRPVWIPLRIRHWRVLLLPASVLTFGHYRSGMSIPFCVVTSQSSTSNISASLR